MTMVNRLPLFLAFLSCALVFSVGSAPADRFCNSGDTRIACSLPSGDYHVRTPDGPGPFPAVVILHSAGETGADIVNDPFYVAMVLGRGFAIVAPTGRPQPYSDGRTATGWHVRKTSTGGRDDAAFITSVIEVAAQRFQLDRKRTLLTGYGNGATLVWELACLSPSTASAYAPMNGGFYEALPGRCRAPVRMFVLHSRRDGFWPLDADDVRVQANRATPVPTRAHLELIQRINGCGTPAAGAGEAPENTTLIGWRGCHSGSDLVFLEQQGTAVLTADIFATVLDWFEPPAPPSRVAPPGVGSVFRRPGEGPTPFGKRPPAQ